MMRDHREDGGRENLGTRRGRIHLAAQRHEVSSLSFRRERALEAMAHAALRARELMQASEAHSQEPARVARDVSERRTPERYEPDVARTQPPPPASAPSMSTFRRHRARAKTVLQVSVVVVAALVLGLCGALAALDLHEPAGVASSGAGVMQSRHHPPSTSGTSRSTKPGNGRAPSSPAPPTTEPTSPVRASNENTRVNNWPNLLSIRPHAGGIGQVVTVSGTNLYSPDGLVQASLGGADAPIRCPTQSTCVLTVPAGLGPSADIPLTIETEAGTSNALSFSYE
jgi:hypothetical protein